MESPSENKENTMRGCLTSNDKIYSVYDGHNTVGRNPDAVINIKNLNVSKHHAVITVINQEDHYISDFKSSNGTILDGKKLNPLALYKIQNGSSIKFGDVFCTYKKLESSQNIPKNVDDSQQFSEGFYATSTQEMHLPNVPEGINFNEMPTQMFTHRELSINEMPTQIQNYTDESSNDSIDLITMQKSTESQMIKFDKNSNSLIDSDEEAETPRKCVSQASSNSSQIGPVRKNAKKIVDSETEDELNSEICPVKTGAKIVIDSDSEDTEEYVNTSDQKSRYHISDDSETDIEGDDIMKSKLLNESAVVPESEIGEEHAESSMASLRLDINESADCGNEDSFKVDKVNKKVLPQDHVYCQALSQTQDNLHRNEEPQENVKDGLTVSEPVEEDLQNAFERDLTPEIIEKEEEKKSSQENSNKDFGTNETTSGLPPPKVDERREDIFDQPTQQVNFDFNESKVDDHNEKGQENKDLSERSKLQIEADLSISKDLAIEHLSDQSASKKDRIDEKNDRMDDDDIFLQPTQSLDYLENRTAEISKDSNSKQTLSKEVDNIFIQPPQIVPPPDSIKAREGPKEEDEIYLRPTQALEELHGDEDRLTEMENATEKNESLETTQTLESLLDDDITKNKKQDEDALLPPTQALELLHGDDKITELEKSLSTRSEEADEFLIPPTQALENLLSEPGPSKNPDDAFLPPNPFKNPLTLKKSIHKPKEDENSFLLPPTQAMEVLHEDGSPFNKVEDQLHEIFASQSLLCTQQLVDVLNTSREDDVIDDSIVEEETRRSLSLQKSAPLSLESVKEILADDEENVDVTPLAVTRSSARVKTYSMKKKENDEIVDEKKTEADKLDKVLSTSRRGRRKQELEVREETNDKVVDVEQTVEASAKTGRKLVTNLAAINNNDECSDNSKTGKIENKRRRGKSVNISVADDQEANTKSSKNSVSDDDGQDSGKSEERQRTAKSKSQYKESSAESKNSSQNSDIGGNRRGMRRQKVNECEDKETGVQGTLEQDEMKNEESSSKDSGSDGTNRRNRRKPRVDEDEDKEQEMNEIKGRRRLPLVETKNRESSVESSKEGSQSSSNDGNNRRGRSKGKIDDENKEQIRSETTGRRKVKQGETKNRESSVESSKEGSQTSSNDGNRRRGSRRGKDDDENKDQEKTETTGSGQAKQGKTKNRGSSVESSKDGSQNCSKDGNSRRGRRKMNTDDEDKQEEKEESKGRVKAMLEETKSVESFKEGSQNSNNSQRGRRKQNNDEKETSTKKDASKEGIDNNEGKRIGRRNKTVPELCSVSEQFGPTRLGRTTLAPETCVKCQHTTDG